MKDSSLKYPNVTAEDWAKKHFISVRPSPCKNCGETLTPTKPFATGEWVGLTSEPHGCGVEFDLFIATKATQAERQEYIDYFQVLQAHLPKYH